MPGEVVATWPDSKEVIHHVHNGTKVKDETAYYTKVFFKPVAKKSPLYELLKEYNRYNIFDKIENGNLLLSITLMKKNDKWLSSSGTDTCFYNVVDNADKPTQEYQTKERTVNE